MNHRASGIVESLIADVDVAKIRAFLYETSATAKVQNAFTIVSRTAVPAAFQRFVKRFLGDGYVLVSAAKVDEGISSELLAVPCSRQAVLNLWDDGTIDRLRELTERRQAGEKLLLRCAPVAFDLALQLSDGLSAEAFIRALPHDEDEAFVVRCLLDVLSAHSSFAAGVTEPIPFSLSVSPPSSVSTSEEQRATGWVVRDLSTCGVVKLATGPDGRKYSFKCDDKRLFRPLFEAWSTGSTVAIKFTRQFPIGHKRQPHYGELTSAEIHGTSLLASDEDGAGCPRPPSQVALHS